MEEGASWVAVISAIAHADNPYAATQQFKCLVDNIKWYVFYNSRIVNNKHYTKEIKNIL